MVSPRRNYWDKFASSKLILNYEISNLDYLKGEALKGLSQMDPNWPFQNDKMDIKSGFVYDIDSFEQLQKKMRFENIDDSAAVNYILHRWYNRMSSSACEDLFCSFNIVRKEPNSKRKGIDFYICGIPFDLKVTRLPIGFRSQIESIESVASKEKLIKWLYASQSKQKRFHTGNRIFIMTKSKDDYTLLEKKFDFDIITPKIESFLKNCLSNISLNKLPFNVVHLDLITPKTKTSPGGPWSGEVFSDIIFID